MAELTGGLMRERVSLTLNRSCPRLRSAAYSRTGFSPRSGFSGGSKDPFPWDLGTGNDRCRPLGGRPAGESQHDSRHRHAHSPPAGRRYAKTSIPNCSIKMVISNGGLERLFVGGVEEAWRRAAVEAGQDSRAAAPSTVPKGDCMLPGSVS